MPPETMTIEDERLMNLEEARRAEEMAQEEAAENQTATPSHFINSGEASLILGFAAFIVLAQWGLEALPTLVAGIPIIGWIIGGAMTMAGYVVNIIITIFALLILLLWTNGKVAKGAPKSWYKTIIIGAFSNVLPFVPGFLGAIIYLIMTDRKIFGKLGTKLIEKFGKAAVK